MEVLFNVLLFIVLLVSAILLSWLLSSNIRDDRVQSNNGSAKSIIPNSSCLMSLDLLPNTSDLICCRNNFYSDMRYDPIRNVVLSSTPEYWVNGCSGFCPQNLVTPDGSQCLLEPSNQQYIICIANNRPVGCSGLAVPVGRNGTNYMYIVSAGNNLCPDDVKYIC